MRQQDLVFPTRKPPADCYVDDRAVRFNGSFEEVLPQIFNFKAHWEKMTLNEALINANGGHIEIEADGTVSLSAKLEKAQLLRQAGLEPEAL